jgi:16S rRNA (cytosine1402-N4)-methyltransferase
MVACRMSDIKEEHQPVLLTEALTALAVIPDGVYVDATFGRGGHSRALLSQLGAAGRLLAMDKDPKAIAYAKKYFSHDNRFTIYHGSFSELKKFAISENVLGKIQGILFDLGVSSPQLDDPARGFSFLRSGALDMRMDSSRGIDAATWIASVSEQDLANVLWELGEERHSRRIARAIVASRQNEPITTTQQLAEIIKLAHPAWPKGKNPATQSFQAIRIAINNELGDLTSGLEQSLDVLAVGGHLAVISFHSLEDRIVKHFIQQHERADSFPAKLPIKQSQFCPRLKRLGRAIKPSEQEISMNPRARSAVLRVGEKLS